MLKALVNVMVVLLNIFVNFCINLMFEFFLSGYNSSFFGLNSYHFRCSDIC